MLCLNFAFETIKIPSMKKLYFTLAMMASSIFAANAQTPDTLLFEDFEADTIDYIISQAPTGSDTWWVNFDADGIPDGSGSNRAGDWFLIRGFADVDSTTTAIGCNSWSFPNVDQQQNWLMLPPITLTDNSGMLYWKSASRQTPLYLDGYQVRISTNGNLENAFNDTVAEYAEYEGSPANVDSSNLNNLYNGFTFSQGFVAGQDGQFIEYHGDSLRFICQLRPDSISLAAYSGQTIYIAFLGNAHDDNLLEIDDIRVMGKGFANTGVNENQANAGDVRISPNPASDFFRLDYTINKGTQARIDIYDMAGKLVKTEKTGFLMVGDHFSVVNVADMPAGNYFVNLTTNDQTTAVKLTVTH
jgi:hypothetical protein